jgi:hypothetical protein
MLVIAFLHIVKLIQLTFMTAVTAKEDSEICLNMADLVQTCLLRRADAVELTAFLTLQRGRTLRTCSLPSVKAPKIAKQVLRLNIWLTDVLKMDSVLIPHWYLVFVLIEAHTLQTDLKAGTFQREKHLWDWVCVSAQGEERKHLWDWVCVSAQGEERDLLCSSPCHAIPPQRLQVLSYSAEEICPRTHQYHEVPRNKYNLVNFQITESLS